MKFALDRKNLVQILTPIQAVIPPRTTLPTLQNLRLTAELGKSPGNGKLKFEATDLDVSLCRSVETQVEAEGSMLVSAKRLYEIVRELPDLPVRLEQTDFTLVLSCERCIFKLPGSGTEDYPQIAAAPQNTSGAPEHMEEIRLKVSSLLRAIDKVSFAISTDESRPALCGLLWQISKSEMKLVATDGHRLALMSTGSFSEFGNLSARQQKSRPSEESRAEDVSDASPAAGVPKDSTSDVEGSCKQVIVPQKALHLLDLILKPYFAGSGGGEDSEFVIDVQFEESKMGFMFSFPEGDSTGFSGSVYVSSRLISGLYPDYNSVLPKENDKIIKVDKDEFVRAIRRVAIFSDPYTHLVKFSFGSEKIGLSASSPQGGEAYDEVACDYGGEGLEMGYNANYVLDVLKRLETEQIEIDLRSPVDAGIFVPTEQKEKEEILYLLMPIRLLGQ